MINVAAVGGRTKSVWRLKHATLLCALACVAVSLTWQWALVTSLYNGNLTALFHHGNKVQLPDDPILKGTYIFNSLGYDAEFYHLVAHDPFLTRGYSRVMDTPRMRYQRILVPGLAFLLAAGQQSWIDRMYLSIILLSVFAGAFWLSRIAESHGRSRAWGFAFLLMPATFPSLENSTIDVTLAALAIGFAWYSQRSSNGALFAVLTLAALTRETGFVLILASLLAGLRRRDVQLILASACAAILPLTWYAWISFRLGPDPFRHVTLIPFSSLWTDVSHPEFAAQRFAWLIQSTHYLALGGMILAFALAAFNWRMVFQSATRTAIAGFTGLAMFIGSPGLWNSPFHFGRVFCPLLALLFIVYLTTKDRWSAVPICMVIPGVLLFSANTATKVVGAHIHAGDANRPSIGRSLQ